MEEEEESKSANFASQRQSEMENDSIANPGAGG